MLKRVLVLLMIMTLTLSLVAYGNGTTTAKDTNENESKQTVVSESLNQQIQNATKISYYVVNTSIDEMGTVKFGSYPQSDANGSMKEPVEWIVLDRKDNKTLLLSKYILDCKCYNNETTDVTWETCNLREWLNNYFYYHTFSSAEQEKIQTTNVINNSNNIDYGTNGGNNTNDKVFCLSIEEIKKYFGDGEKGDKGYLIGKKVATRGTNFAKSVENEGAHLVVSEKSDWSGGNSVFWLRSPGESLEDVAYVNAVGYLFTNGCGAYRNKIVGVRPALWVEN